MTILQRLIPPGLFHALPKLASAVAIESHQLMLTNVKGDQKLVMLSCVNKWQADGNHLKWLARLTRQKTNPHGFIYRQGDSGAAPEKRRHLHDLVQNRYEIALANVFAGHAGGY